MPPLLRLLPLSAGGFLLLMGLVRRDGPPPPPFLRGPTVAFHSHHDRFCVSEPLLRAPEPDPDEITFVTQGSLEHVHLLLGLDGSWEGPIVATVFLSSEAQLGLLIAMLKLALACRPGFGQALTLRAFYRSSSCGLVVLGNASDVSCPSDCADCVRSLGQGVEKDSAYPVNAARNLARTDAQTRLQLVADIQLQPSLGLASRFRDFESQFVSASGRPSAFVIPVFESNASLPVPTTLAELRAGARSAEVVPFHLFRAPDCHQIPKLHEWWREEVVGVHASSDWLRPCWEPVFVSRADAPLYDERFEGYGRNKIQQVYEMCRQGYEFHVLSGVFLVHGGISILTSELWAAIGKQVLANNKLFQEFKKGLDTVYGLDNEWERYCNAAVMDRDGMSIHLPS